MERRERENDVYAVIKISYKFLGRVRQSCVDLVPAELDFSPLLGSAGAVGFSTTSTDFSLQTLRLPPKSHKLEGPIISK